MTIAAININFSLFPNTVVIKYFYDYSHQICETSYNQGAHGSWL